MRNRNPPSSTTRKARPGADSPVSNADTPAASSPTANTPVNVEMVIRVWAPAPHAHDSASATTNAAHHPGVLALIEDVVAARHGVLVAGEDSLHVSGLAQPADALLVSRQIQTCMQGFRPRHGAATVALSIAIDATARGKRGAARESDSSAHPSEGLAEPSYDLVTLLKLSKPAQVLATHDLCSHIHDLPGLPLKSFPARFGVFEYLWTAEDKLELLQSEPQLTLTALPAVAHVDRESASPAPPAIPAPKSPVHEDPVSLPELDQARLLGMPRFVFIPAAALLAVAIIAFLGIRAVYHRPAPSAPTNAANTLSTAPSVSTPQPTSTAPVAAASEKPAPPVAPPSSAAASDAASTPKPAPQSRSRKAASIEKSTAAQPPACTLSDDPSRLIRLAEQYRARGDYKNAERVFHQVLQCEPNNAAARVGLSRAEAGEAESRR